MGKLFIEILAKVVVILNDAVYADQIKSNDIVKQLKLFNSILKLIYKELQGGKHDN